MSCLGTPGRAQSGRTWLVSMRTWVRSSNLTWMCWYNMCAWHLNAGDRRKSGAHWPVMPFQINEGQFLKTRGWCSSGWQLSVSLGSTHTILHIHIRKNNKTIFLQQDKDLWPEDHESSWLLSVPSRPHAVAHRAAGVRGGLTWVVWPCLAYVRGTVFFFALWEIFLLLRKALLSFLSQAAYQFYLEKDLVWATCYLCKKVKEQPAPELLAHGHVCTLIYMDQLCRREASLWYWWHNYISSYA